MTREEAQKILATWLVSSKGADGQRGYIEGWFDEDDAEAFRMAIEALADRPTGEWERVLYKREGHEEVIVDGHSWRCTNCGDARKRNDIDMKYCPNCGAKMRGEEE